MLELSLVLLAAVLISAVIDQIVPKVSSPLIQIGLGLAIALLTTEQIDISLDPELFLVMFIAPLLYDEARHIDKGELWRNKIPVLSMAIGLVVVIAIGVGFALHWLVPSIPLTAAFALGAALGPTDAVAVSTLPKDASIGTRERSILKGECLLNDASGIVTFQFAIAATATGAFSLISASIDFVISFFGGILTGVVLGLASKWIIGRTQSLGLENTTFHVLFDIFTPFIVFLAAENLHVSGILAVVATGLVVSVATPKGDPAASRLNIVSSSVWRVITFALNGIVFVLLGTQLPRAMQSTWEDVRIDNGDLLLYVALLTALIVVIRFIWLLGIEMAHHRGFSRKKKANGKFGKQHVISALIMTIGGPKGTITLSIMFTIPFIMEGGGVFPQRNLLIFLACGVIVCTLLLSTFVIPLFAPKHDARTDVEEERRRDVEASIDILRSVVEELTGRQTPETRRATQSVIHQYNKRIAHIKENNDIAEEQDVELRVKVIDWEREYIKGMLERGEIEHPSVASDYLDRLERIENLLLHRGSDETMGARMRRARNFFRSLKRRIFEGVPFLNESEHAAAMRQLQLAASQMVVKRLQDNISEIDAPAENISALSMEYSRACAALRAEQPSITTLTNSARKAADIQRTACQLELEAIQQAYDDGQISRTAARRMRENVLLMQMDLEGSV